MAFGRGLFCVALPLVVLFFLELQIRRTWLWRTLQEEELRERVRAEQQRRRAEQRVEHARGRGAAEASTSAG